MKSRIIIALSATATLLAGCAANRHPTEFIGAERTNQITEIHMLNVHDGWAWSGGLAGQQRLLRTTDGGATWRDVTPRGISHIEEGASFYDAHTAWVSFFDHTNITAGLLRTTDGGQSWQLLNQTNTPIFNEASSCQFYSANYGVGSTADGGLGSSYVTFFETHDAGKTWKVMPFRPPDHVSDVFTNMFEMFHLSNIGGDRIAVFPPASAIISRGDAADEKPKGMVRLSLTKDLGNTWCDLKLPLPEKYHDYLCIPLRPVFLDQKNIILATRVFKVAPDGSYGNGALVFYSSRDAGATWTMQPTAVDLAYPWIGDFEVCSPECFFAQTVTNVLVTEDAAHTWKSVTQNISFGEHPDRDILNIDFVDVAHGWLVLYDRAWNGGFHLFRTSNGGKTWAELPVRMVKS